MDLAGYIRERSPAIEAALDAALPAASVAPQRLHAAMRHLLFPGGKRIRPLLCCAGAEALGADPGVALPAAVAAELIHTYSLIHDDLPCMDDDAERRGRPTVHVAYGEAEAVLAGDALLAAAFEALLAAPGPAPERRVAAALEFARAAGSQQLVGGQSDDLAASGRLAERACIESIHLRKTAALIAASVVAGAVLAGADDATREALRVFGLELGRLFQLVDDLLDGERPGECSLLRVATPRALREEGEALLQTVLGRLDAFGPAAQPLRELALFAARRDR